MPLALPLLGCNSSTPTEVKFTLKSDSAKIHTELQDQFLNSSDPDAFIETHPKADFARVSQSKPNPVKFSWSYKASKPNKTTLSIAEDSSMSKGLLTYEVDGKSLDVFNLKVNTTYYYQVKLDYKETSFTSEVASKTITDKSVRNLNIDGVENVRDMGGYEVDGGRIRQGLLYRSAEFNLGKGDTFNSVVTEEGKKELLDVLKIKSDIDLRKTTAFSSSKDEIGSITESPLGSSVTWKSFPMNYGGMNIYTQAINSESIYSFFEYLSHEESYPAIYHCIRGTDRTGALGYVLGALCGVSKEDLMKDYLFSNFANIDDDPYKTSNITSKAFYVYTIENYSNGETFKDKAANYIMDKFGVTNEMITSIRNILVEKD